MSQDDPIESLQAQGQRQLDRGAYAAALETFQQAAALDPQNPQLCCQIGQAYYLLERYPEAIDTLTQALELRPAYLLALVRRGLAYRELGQTELANTDCEQTIQLQPQTAEDWRSRAIALSELKQHEEALVSYDRALELNPNAFLAWNNRGLTLLDLDLHEEALANYDRGIEINPEYPGAWFNRGNVLDKLGRYDAALESYNRALELKPDDSVVWSNRSALLWDLRRYEEAIDSCDRALRFSNQQEWRAWANRGLALLGSQGYKTALKNWNNGLLALQPQTVDYQRGCGELHRIKGEYQYRYGQQQANPFPEWFEARKSYESALKFLSVGQFPQRYLQVLQESLKVYASLGDRQAIDQSLEVGAQRLETWLRQCPLREKIVWSRRFAGFHQLRVDRLAQSADRKQQIAALELAEQRKNTCLGWMQRGWDYAPPDVTFAQMQPLLDRRTAALYWHVSPTAMTTFVLRHGGKLQVQTLLPQVQPAKWLGLFPRRPKPSEPQDTLPAVRQLEQFETWLTAWQRDYAAYRQGAQAGAATASSSPTPWRRQLATRLKQLGEILGLRQILSQLDGIQRLILLPHRQLHWLPLHAWFELAGDCPFAISYLPSAKLGLELQQRPASWREKETAALLSIEHPQTRRRLYPDKPLDLLFAELESQLIAARVPGAQRLAGRQAGKPQVLAALQRPTARLHFTGHGYHDTEQPVASALALAGEAVLTLQDLFQLPGVGCQLVSLSACETGLTSGTNLVDEFVGLASGFLAMGATWTVSTLWTVDEVSTALLMVRFYRELERQSPAVALQRAKQWLRQLAWGELGQWYAGQAEGLAAESLAHRRTLTSLARLAQRQADKMGGTVCPYADPYYWAGFIVTGKV